MSYNSIVDVADDAHLRPRLIACASQELPVNTNPGHWVETNIWALAGAPGWAAAYASAVASDVPEPGRDEAVITDSMILSAVQARVSETE